MALMELLQVVIVVTGVVVVEVVELEVQLNW